MLAVGASYPWLSVLPETEMSKQKLGLDSTLECLNLYNFELESSEPGMAVAQALAENPLMPGVILTQEGQFVGMISRKRFLEHMSRPHGVDLFSRRPIKILYQFTESELLIFPSHTLIVMAARRCLQRSPELLDEPIVVELGSQVYRLLDIQQLLVAQSHIHELATKLLNEQTKAQLIQTEKMASLGQMVAGVAHEIRNPVNCIGGNIGFLLNYFQDMMVLLSAYEEHFEHEPETITEVKEEIEFEFLKKDLPKIMKGIQVAADRLTKIAGGMRNFSHMDESNRKPANLHECIDSTLLILDNRLKHGIELIKEYADLPEINCYSGQLSQVFMNIITNALDALMEKVEQCGEKATWKPQIEVKTEIITIESSQWVSIRIADNGPGIRPEIQQRIFENFFTTKPVGKGTGLGLAISHQIVTEKHGGQLNLKSEIDKGTEFEILLPLG